MARYAIEFTGRAYRQLVKLERAVQTRLAPAIDALADDPLPASHKKLTGAGEFYRIRVGVYRIVYTVEEDRLLVLVVKLGHRGDVYRRR